MAKWLLLLLSFNLHAYTLKDMDLSKYEFSRYVKPQLKSIITEYSSLFISLNEFLAPFKSSLAFYRDTSDSLEKIEAQCPLINNETCKKHLDQLTQELKNHLRVVDSIQFTPSPSNSLTQYLSGLGLLEEFKLSLVSTYVKLDAHLAEYEIKGTTTLRGATVIHWITQLDFLLNTFLLGQVDSRYQNSITAFWIDFVRPVHQIILPKDDLEYFKKNLTELNIRWNELHVFLSKKNIEVSKHASTLLNIMHNRWNNILKVTLKPI